MTPTTQRSATSLNARPLSPSAPASGTQLCQLPGTCGAVRATLDELFDDLKRRCPGLRFHVVDQQRLLRPNMRVFVNGLGVRDLQHPLHPNDFVAVVLALSGG